MIITSRLWTYRIALLVVGIILNIADSSLAENDGSLGQEEVDRDECDVGETDAHALEMD